ncbi:MAG: hypothetical protein AB4368_17660 [Xenococcaceae cyanobacterium]
MSKSLLRTLGLILCGTAMAIAAKYYFRLNSIDLANIDSLLTIPQLHILKNFSPPNWAHSVNSNFDRIEPEINNTDLVVNQNSFFSLEEFPLGWFDRINRLKTASTISKEGFNLLLPYSLGKDFDTIRHYLDNAQSQGIKVFLQFYPDVVKREKIEVIQKFVRAFKDHPALFAWYSFDEPELNNVSPKTLELVYQTIKAEDSSHPVAVVFNGSVRKIKPYANTFDIFMYDKYPCWYGEPEFSNSKTGIDYFRRRVMAAGNYARSNQMNFLPVLQAYGRHEQDIEPNAKRRFCTQKEQRYMLYTSILAGADGLFFYGHHRTKQSWVDSTLTPLIQEFKPLIPAIQTEPLWSKDKNGRKNIQSKLYHNKNNGQFILIAVNHENSSIDRTIELNANTNVNYAKVIGENRWTNIGRGIIKDSFAPYAVHIYSFY